MESHPQNRAGKFLHLLRQEMMQNPSPYLHKRAHDVESLQEVRRRDVLVDDSAETCSAAIPFVSGPETTRRLAPH